MTPGDVLQRIYEVTGYLPRGAGPEKSARCPGPMHRNGDRNPSMSVRITPDKVLIYCQVCREEGLPAILSALALTESDLFAEPLPEERRRKRPDTWVPCKGKGHVKIAEYPYEDESENLLYAVTRCDRKCFACWRPDPAKPGGRRWSLKDADGNLAVRQVPFRLPQLIAAVAAERVIWIVEGEKDALAVVERPGCVATCGRGGAGKGWQPEYTPFFTGADVCIVADRDPEGRKYAESIIDALMPVARCIDVIQARHGKDAFDHFAAGGTTGDFVVVGSPKPFPMETSWTTA